MSVSYSIIKKFSLPVIIARARYIILLAPRSDSKIAGSASSYSLHPELDGRVFIEINKFISHISSILLTFKDYGRVYCSLVESTVVFSDSLIMTWED